MGLPSKLPTKNGGETIYVDEDMGIHMDKINICIFK